MNSANELIGTRELAVRLGCPEALIHYLIRRGAVAPPALVAGVRLWRPEDVRACAQAIRAHRPRGVRHLAPEIRS